MSGTALEASPEPWTGAAGQIPPFAKRAPHAPAREGAETMPAALVPRVVSVEIPPIPLRRRTPYVAVRVELGPLVLVLGVVLPRVGSLALRVPASILGCSSVTASPETFASLEAMVLAAVRADRAACRHLDNHRRERFSGELGP